MKKNQNGVTLIALVVTIVVMLILAATALAMLNGDSGIITNAQKARAANTESTVVDTMDNAYNSLKTEATVKMATQVGYRPSDIDKAKKLLDYVKTEIGDVINSDTDIFTGSNLPEDLTKTASEKPGYIVYLEGKDPVMDTDGTTVKSYESIDIVMVYRDTTFDLAKVTETPAENEYPKDNQYPLLEGRITLTTSGVSYTKPTRSTLV